MTTMKPREPEWQIRKVNGRYWLSRMGWLQGRFPTLQSAVIERQRVTGVRQIDLIRKATR